MALPADEAEQLTDAIREFQKHHEVPALSDKRVSEFMLASALVSIGWPRALLFLGKNKVPPAAPGGPVATVGPIAPSEPLHAATTEWFDPSQGMRPN